MSSIMTGVACAATVLALSGGVAHAQSAAGIVRGTVTDPTGAVVPGATVTIANVVSGYSQTAQTDTTGQYVFFNVPFNPYRITATATGFSTTERVASVASQVPVVAPIKLTVKGTGTVVTVTADNLLEADTTMHTDIDRSTINKMPIESASSSLSSIVTLASPGVAADSNGLFHGLGDHAENSFSIDGQPITDQQSKVFSNQLPASAVQSLSVIDGAPPAEYGDKTSLVIVVTTRSGQGVTTPHGQLSASYGTFGTSTLSGNIAYGTRNFGNFLSIDGLNSGRFLDGPEFQTLHDKGNEENVFDRIDRQFSDVSTAHLNLQYTRSWFQTPNSFDTNSDSYNGVGQTDQRSKIETFDIAPTYTRTLSPDSVMNFGGYVRKDGYNYNPSFNPLADLGPIQQESVAQYRSLTNAGLRSDVSYIHGIHTAKAGVVYEQTFLRENDTFSVVDPTLNAPCLDVNGNAVNGYTATSQCLPAGYQTNPNYTPILAPYDFTRGGGFYHYYGHTDVKQLALYAEDQIAAGNWTISLGMRGDIYNGLAIQRQAEPRAGLSYAIKRTGTILRASYSRAQETPFNENLVLSTNGCYDKVVQAIFETLGPCTPAPFNPGFRNEFHVGLQQAFGGHLVISGEYIWKYTHNAYDFSVFGATPITFPIEWHNSKIPGVALRANVPQTHGISAFFVMSSVAARFYNPQIGGVGATVGTAGSTLPFRIDHDERYNQNANIQYALPFHKSTYFSMNWRYDSGLVAGAAPCYNVIGANTTCGGITLPNGQPGVDLSGLTPDEQFQAGLICDGVAATPTSGFTACDNAGYKSSLLKIPAPNTEDDDKNPPRTASRNLFDMTLGDDRLAHFSKDRYSVGARLTAINVTNKVALYNFLSTFSGTHYVTPRSITGQISLNF
jgi:hypothetical protein